MDGLSTVENFPTDILVVVVEVIRIYAKLESAKGLLVQLRNGHWLGQILQYCVDGTVGANSNNISLLCMELLGLIKDLTFRSSVFDKETILSLRGGVFGGLLASICKAGETADRRLVNWFTAVIWNLVLDKSICDKIMDLDKTHDFPVIKYLLRILNGNLCISHATPKNDSQIRRNAISCIGNMLSRTDNQMLLIHDGRAKNLAIIRTLVAIVEQDSDSIVRRRAMRTLRCLACSQEKQVRASLNQHDVPSVYFGAIARRIAEDDENDRDMQIQACLAICASIDSLSCSDWPRLETVLLQRIETSNDEKIIQAACSCLVECIKHSPWRRGPSGFSDLFWARLEVAATSSAEPHSSISCLLIELARLETKYPESTKSTHPSNLTNSAPIKIMSHLISLSSEEHREIRQNALETISSLATNIANRRALAENESLLSALVNLCLLQPDAATKEAAKQIIVDLVPEL
jgi:hypothetical protein